MYIEKPNSPINSMSDLQYKFCVSEEYEKQEMENLERRRNAGNSSVFMIFEDHYGFEDPVCPYCGAKHVVKHNYNPKNT